MTKINSNPQNIKKHENFLPLPQTLTATGLDHYGQGARAYRVTLRNFWGCTEQWLGFDWMMKLIRLYFVQLYC